MTNKAKFASKDGQIIRIQNEFSIRNADEITKRLKKNLVNVKSAVIRLDSMEQMDLSAIQVIYAIRRYAEKKNIELQIESTLSDDLIKLINNNGFNELL